MQISGAAYRPLGLTTGSISAGPGALSHSCQCWPDDHRRRQGRRPEEPTTSPEGTIPSGHRDTRIRPLVPRGKRRRMRILDRPILRGPHRHARQVRASPTSSASASPTSCSPTAVRRRSPFGCLTARCTPGSRSALRASPTRKKRRPVEVESTGLRISSTPQPRGANQW